MTAHHHDSENSTTLTATLKVVSAELIELGQIASDLQDTFGQLGPAARLPSTEVIENMQSLDSLTQHLYALATFLDSLSDIVPLDCRVSAATAAQHVTLAELASRLTSAGRAPDPARKSNNGDLEFFDLVEG